MKKTKKKYSFAITIVNMTPDELKNGREKLNITYSVHPSEFGQVIIASTSKGVCYLGFDEDVSLALSDLARRFPHAVLSSGIDDFQQQALAAMSNTASIKQNVKLHIYGTPFQLTVWESLLNIPFGQVTSYGKIAQAIGKPTASRAVGTAIGSNPVSFIIPCHRVIQASGKMGGYHWGLKRKIAILDWEAEKQ